MENQERYCEHCQQEVERTHEAGKVIVLFGEMSFQPEGRVFVFSNPDFARQHAPNDVSEVYLDTKTCKPRQIERFLTFVSQYSSSCGLQSVHILYQGKLEESQKRPEENI